MSSSSDQPESLPQKSLKGFKKEEIDDPLQPKEWLPEDTWIEEVEVA